MKTTVHAHRTHPVPTSSVRLAAVVSVVAAIAAVLLRILTDVPQAAVVLGVILVAFTLSWHATWRTRPDER